MEWADDVIATEDEEDDTEIAYVAEDELKEIERSL